jgi:hypothetical protein
MRTDRHEWERRGGVADKQGGRASRRAVQSEGFRLGRSLALQQRKVDQLRGGQIRGHSGAFVDNAGPSQ